jgi:hypothetical protein
VWLERIKELTLIGVLASYDRRNPSQITKKRNHTESDQPTSFSTASVKFERSQKRDLRLPSA